MDSISISYKYCTYIILAQPKMDYKLNKLHRKLQYAKSLIMKLDPANEQKFVLFP